MEPPPDQYDSSYQEDYEEEIPDGLPFAKGDFEPGFLFGIWGDRDVFFLTVGGSFAYYVINRLAPGIELQYATYFSDMYDYPQSFAILPFLQFVILREGGFLPFITATGGREFQWDGSSNPTKGVKATHAWIAGGGGGLYIRIWKAFFFRIQFSVLYYWYDKTKVIALDDDLFTETDSETGETIAVLDEDFKPCGPGPEQCYVYSKSDDTKDIDGEPIYFLTFGPTFFF
ncbi:MAG: hypothetical protein GY847_34095 [Proteobacteria bacterium]|nr:hypothetical protein [Pseudomonadota bacterium]